MDVPRDPQTFFESFLPSMAKGIFSRAPGMEGVEGAIEFILTGPGGGTWAASISKGAFSVRRGTSEQTLLRIRQTIDDWRTALERGIGGIEGALGASPAGGGRPFSLTPQKIQKVKSLKGALALDLTEVTPGRALRTLFHFGPPPVKENPDATILIRAQDYAEMMGGKLNPQAAFMAGKVKLVGDMNLAMQVAMLLGPA